MTEQANMKLFLASIMDPVFRPYFSHWYSPNIPSSTLIFELNSDANGNYFLNVLFNDQPAPIGDCDTGSNCSLSLVVEFLAEVIKVSDAASACKQSTSHEQTVLQL
jgi:hypothetical protein